MMVKKVISTYLLGSVLALLTMTATVETARAEFISFDPLEVTGTGGQVFGGIYTEDGFDLWAGDGAISWFYWEQGAANYGGSAGLSANDQNQKITLTRSDSGLFSIISIDFDRMFRVRHKTESVTVTGFFQDLTSIEETFFLDESSGFQTFYFSSLWTDLISVEWVNAPILNTTHQFDAIVLKSINVPAPPTLTMFAAAIIGIAIRRFSSKLNSLFYVNRIPKRRHF